MRELQFRRWIESHGMFAYYDLNTLETNSPIEGPYWHELKTPIQQFTGFKDEKGRYLYDGDLVFYKGEPRPRQKEFNGLVAWNGCDGCWAIKYCKDKLWDLYEVALWCEIIGNIHENPELLRA